MNDNMLLIRQHVQVTDYQLVDSLVLSLIGMDNDQGQDGYLSYSITEGNTDYFKLVQISNTLVHLVISHSPLVPGNYLVQVTVTDGGSPARSDVAMVTASVIASSQIQCNESLFGKRYYSCNFLIDNLLFTFFSCIFLFYYSLCYRFPISHRDHSSSTPTYTL